MSLRDPICSLSHLSAAFAALYATLLLIRLTRRMRGRRLAATIFGCSMVLLFAASGVFHGLPISLAESPSTFRVFQRIDQSAIFLMIAGTNTPIMVILLTKSWRLWCISGMWSLAAAAIASLWLFPKPPHEAIVLFCLGMGFIGLLPLIIYYRAVGWRAMNWVWTGTALYTTGALFELTEWPTSAGLPWRLGFHEVFHVIVALASLFFFVFVARHVLPYRVTLSPVAKLNAHSRDTTARD